MMKMLAGGLAVLLVGMAGAAHAQRATFYVGGDIAKVTTKVTDKTGIPPIVSGEADTTTLRLKGGAHFLPWFDLELQALFPNEETFSRVATNNTVKSGVFAIFAKPKAAFGPVEAYALVGISTATVEMTGVFSGKKTRSDLAYGVGAQYVFTPNWAASLEFTQYNKQNLETSNFAGGVDIDIKAVSVGVAYTF